MGDTHAGETAGIDFRQVIKEIKTIAVVGYSDNPERAGHYVPRYMAEHGYEIIAINPRFKDKVDGYKCYPNLAAIPKGTKVDAVDVFRSADFVPPLVDEAAALNPAPKYFWMQPGTESEEAARLARERGMTPITGACMMAAHKIWI